MSLNERREGAGDNATKVNEKAQKRRKTRNTRNINRERERERKGISQEGVGIGDGIETRKAKNKATPFLCFLLFFLITFWLRVRGSECV